MSDCRPPARGHALIVIGVGNAWCSDDGIGGVVARALDAQCADLPAVQCLDAGASGMRLVHLLAGQRKAIIIDCVLMGEPPGTIRRFTPEEVSTAHSVRALSLHDGNLLETIMLAQAFGDAPPSRQLRGMLTAVPSWSHRTTSSGSHPARRRLSAAPAWSPASAPAPW